jgi:hypothetical protein
MQEEKGKKAMINSFKNMRNLAEELENDADYIDDETLVKSYCEVMANLMSIIEEAISLIEEDK